MAQRNEALGFYRGYTRNKARTRRFIKRQTARYARRVGKQMLEEAPKRRTAGWAD